MYHNITLKLKSKEFFKTVTTVKDHTDEKSPTVNARQIYNQSVPTETVFATRTVYK